MRLSLFFIIIGTIVLWNSQLHAEDVEEVLLVASNEARERSTDMLAAVEGQLSDLPVVLGTIWVDRVSKYWVSNPTELDRVLNGRDPLVLIWWDSEFPAEFFMSVRTNGTRIMISREIAASVSGTGFEAIGLVVHEVVDALLREAEESKNDNEPIEIEAPVTVSRPNTRIILGPEVAYTLRTLSDQISVLHGVNGGLTLLFPFGVRLGASYGFCFPKTIGYEYFELKVLSHQIMLQLGFDRPLGKFRLGAGIGFATDILVQTTRPRHENGGATPSSNTTPYYQLLPTFYAGNNLYGPINLFINAGIFIGLGETNFSVRSPFDYDIVDSLRRVGPFLRFGACVLF